MPRSSASAAHSHPAPGGHPGTRLLPCTSHGAGVTHQSPGTSTGVLVAVLGCDMAMGAMGLWWDTGDGDGGFSAIVPMAVGLELSEL